MHGVKKGSWVSHWIQVKWKEKKKSFFFFNFVFIFGTYFLWTDPPFVYILVSQGGYSGFQVTGMIKWGQKSKPKKIPWDSNKTAKKSMHQNSIPQKSHAEFPNHKNFPESIKWYNTKIEPFSFEYPKKSHLKSSYPKRLVPKCSYLKASWNWKFQTQKNPSIVAVIWNPEYPPAPRICLQDKNN